MTNNAAAKANNPVLTATDLITGATTKETTSAINKAVASIKRRGKMLDRDIHVAAVSAMSHHDKYGDVSLINRLVDAMPKGSRVNALRDFIAEYGRVFYDKKTFHNDKDGTFNLDGALSISWTEFAPEKDYVPLDGIKLLETLMNKIATADPTKGDKVSKELRQSVLDLGHQFGVMTKDEREAAAKVVAS